MLAMLIKTLNALIFFADTAQSEHVSGAGRFAAPSLKPFLLHPAPRSAPRSGHFQRPLTAPLRSAPTNFLAAPLDRSDANASIPVMTELTTE